MIIILYIIKKDVVKYTVLYKKSKSFFICY